MSVKVSPTLFRRSTDFINLAEQLKADCGTAPPRKTNAFETQTEEWRNSEQGDRLADEIALLEDLHDALKTVLHQVHDRFTPEPEVQSFNAASGGPLPMPLSNPVSVANAAAVRLIGPASNGYSE